MGEGTPHPTVVGCTQSRSIAAWILTCPHRVKLLTQTIKSFRDTDWNAPLRIHCTPPGGEVGEPGENPIRRAHLALLKSALDGPGTHFLLCEDDVAFNRHLHHNLTHWDLWREVACVDFATIYNPGLAERRSTDGSMTQNGGRKPGTYFAVEREALIGSQARLVSRRGAEYLLATARGSATGTVVEPGFPDQAGDAFDHVWVHRPSLVQHLGGESSWEGPRHVARDFDPGWRLQER
jgi:hypothetical protein